MPRLGGSLPRHFGCFCSGFFIERILESSNVPPSLPFIIALPCLHLANLFVHEQVVLTPD